MEKKYSEKACLRVVNQLDREIREGQVGSVVGPGIRQPPAHEEDSDERGSVQEEVYDTYSDDEVLSTSAGYHCSRAM